MNNINKPLCIISCPIDCYSGYSARSRDFVKSLIKIKDNEWDIKILSQRWGNCSFGYLKDHNEIDLQSRVIHQITQQPVIFFQITVPNEFQKVGSHYNIGVTAGIETTICDPSWIEGCNRMDLILASSNHAKLVFESSNAQMYDNNTKQLIKDIKLTTRVEVLFEGVDLNKYYKKSVSNTPLISSMRDIKEEFCFLFVGHWLQGEFGEDRKNVGYTIKAFLEVFKNKVNAPALILKTSSGPTSVIDRNIILDKIQAIKKTINGRLPNIYVIHGDLDDSDMNDLYNHPKVKTLISFTKGEGFGRPLLEFSVTEKPLVVSGWSGHMDFIHDETIKIGGELRNVHPSAASPNMILTDASWFKPDDGHVGYIFNNMFENYKYYLPIAKKQATLSKGKFSLDKMTESLESILNKIPEVPVVIPFVMPKLKKIENDKI
jgi:hypothetical protein